MTHELQKSNFCAANACINFHALVTDSKRGMSQSVEVGGGSLNLGGQSGRVGVYARIALMSDSSADTFIGELPEEGD